MRRLGSAAAVLLFSIVSVAGTPGTFRGYLVESADVRHGWMYVQGKKDTVRLVKLSGAMVTYGEEIPQDMRQPDPRNSLQPGTEVRVTAEQVGRGHWRAQHIEILRLAPTRRAGR